LNDVSCGDEPSVVDGVDYCTCKTCVFSVDFVNETQPNDAFDEQGFAFSFDYGDLSAFQLYSFCSVFALVMGEWGPF
jgi:hypothetical protein